MVLTATENKKRIDILVRDLISKYQKSLDGTLVVFEFDKLLVDGHLSQAVAEAFGKMEERTRIIKQYGDHTFEGMAEMNLILKCWRYGELCERKKPVAKNMPWRAGAEELLKTLYQTPGYQTLILSCGRYTPQSIKLTELGWRGALVACEMEFENSVAVRNKHIVSDEIKRYIVRRLKNAKLFQSVYVVGHGDGDVCMLQEGLGLVLNPTEKAREAAQREIRHLNEIYGIIGIERK